MNPNAQTTPMLKQYWQIKAEHGDKDTILFYRLGDFYEMFYEDAEVASKILDITLTSRNKDDANPVPLCGVPYHAAEGYIAKLLASGKKVAICEQVEDPKLAKGVVKREVVRIITPGSVIEPGSLVSKENNYLLAINTAGGSALSIAICDVSTGELRAAVLRDIGALKNEIARLEPREILLPRSLSEEQLFLELKQFTKGAMLTVLDDPRFDASFANNISAEGVPQQAFSSVGALLGYLKYTHKSELFHIKEVHPYTVRDFMVIDEATKRNLELTQTMADAQRKGTLLWLLDRTHTAMGARTLRRWMLYPLLSITEINERLCAVGTLKDDFKLTDSLARDLSEMADVERITSRIVTGCANARELSALKNSLKILPRIKDALSDTDGLLAKLCGDLDTMEILTERIGATLVDEPPLSVRDSGLIRDGVSAELDVLRGMSRDGKGFIASLESSERKRTGIGSLKVGYNRVFGYYIEITHTHRDRIPQDYIRKQTLTNAERFITPALKEYEEKVLGAEERIRALEFEIFSTLRNFAAEFVERLAVSATVIGRLDAILSLARVANENRYCKPTLTDNGELHIVDGRHPIIERLSPTERFVPNDVHLNMSDCRIMVITGPNMAGKSTVMRQTALIILLAQMGSFVPAAEAQIGVVDRIFTRVGASDNLTKGQSTFMVEMNEAALILKDATEKSFILIDEIGRGTSTFDGVSIAWAVAEYLHDHVRAKTLFATHYHELTDLALTKPMIKNFNVAVKEWNDQIIFLRKLVVGSVNRSYGIQVARLAGLPKEVILRAKDILLKLEKGELELKPADIEQMSLFEAPTNAATGASRPVPPCGGTSLEEYHKVVGRLREIDTSVLTPIEALNLLHEWKQRI